MSKKEEFGSRSRGNIGEKRGHEESPTPVSKKQRQEPLEQSHSTSSRAHIIVPEVDFFSELFDPLRALHELKELPPSLPKVKPFDNLSRCRFLLPHGDPNYAPSKPKIKVDENIPKYELETKEIDKKRILIKRELREERKKQEQQQPKLTVLGEITSKCSSGPMSLLKVCMEQKCRVRVAIRRVAEIRGYCTGLLRAYDKHVNLVLSNVEEDYTVFESVTSADGTTKKQRVAKKKRSKLLFIKGDNVVYVSRVVDKPH